MPTGIEWTDETWNPARARALDGSGRIGWHCEHASPGCINCYAETQNRAGRSGFTGTKLPYKPGHRKDVEIYIDEKVLLRPLSWKRPRKVFVCSMTDLFGEFHTVDQIVRVFAVMALCQRHTFQVLTKRSDRAWQLLSLQPDECHRPEAGKRLSFGGRVWEEAYRIAAAIGKEGLFTQALRDGKLQPDSIVWPLPNVWLGVSVEDQQRADERIPVLLDTPAAIRWLSMEPLIEPVDLSEWFFCPTARDESPIMDPTTGVYECCAKCDYTGIAGFSGPPLLDWIVLGGESGPRARPMNPKWARTIRDQCAAAGVPFLFKQWGEWWPLEQAADEWGLTVQEARELFTTRTTETHAVIGKKKAGRLLDGVEHNGYPEIRDAS